MRLLRSHWGFFLLLATAAPLTFAFCWHDGIASVSDDSVSYLVLARHLAGDAGPLLEPWVPLHAHFAPLFPLALALFGGGEDLLLAHLLVAAFALAALAALYRYATLVSGRRLAALALVALFLVTPTAWASIKGILSEPMYLLVSLLALHHFAERLEQAAGSLEDWAIFGALLAAAFLTRTAGLALVAAFAAHAALRLARGPRGGASLRLIIPLAMVAALAAAWVVLRPAASVDGYRHTAGALLQAWIERPGLALAAGSRFLYEGWISSFAVDAEGILPLRLALAAVGAAGIAGTVLRAAGNRLDGWYVLATLAMLLAWVFDAPNMRRLLYPVVPLLLLHAGFAIAAACRSLGRASAAPGAIAAAASLVALVCAPPAWITLQKARDARMLLIEAHYTAADVTDYYLTLDALRARAIAAKHVAVITGLEHLAGVTPPDARILWSRPEYVAYLGRRAGVPLEYRWDERALAEAVQRSGAGFIVAAALAKTDVRHERGDPLAVRQLAAPYTDPVMLVPNAVAGGDEFVLLRVDPGRLGRYLAAQR